MSTIGATETNFQIFPSYRNYFLKKVGFILNIVTYLYVHSSTL